MTNKPYLLYDFDKAPKELQEVCSRGGDEDGILIVPPGVTEDELPYWISRLWDCFTDPKQIELPDGSTAFVWCHA